jgi:hypothetical protein
MSGVFSQVVVNGGKDPANVTVTTVEGVKIQVSLDSWGVSSCAGRRCVPV